MTEILQNLETSQASSFARDEDRFVHDLNRAVAGMQGSARAFEEAWRTIVRKVAEHKTEEMHSLRPQLANALENRLHLMQRARTQAEAFRSLGRSDVTDTTALAGEIASIERFKTRVLDPWMSAEDLEDLAARDYPLAGADLDQVGAQRRPPPSYYTEESKPF